MYVCRSGRYIEKKFIPDPHTHTHTHTHAHTRTHRHQARSLDVVPDCGDDAAVGLVHHEHTHRPSSLHQLLLHHLLGALQGRRREGGREGRGRERRRKGERGEGEREEGREGRGREGGREGEREGVWVVTDTHVYTLRE